MNDFMMKPSQVITNTVQYTEYNLYLHGKIGDADDFMEHFSVYKMANEGDIIRLYITSEGGSLATGMEYIRHMKECQAPIIGILGLEVASMASAIALECDEIEVDDMSTMLVHSFSYGAAGTEASVYNQASFNKKLNERWIRKHYSGFLDDDQFSDIFKGVDILLGADEIMERWGSLQEYRKGQPCDCGNPECGESQELLVEDQSFSLEGMIKQAVAEGIKQHEAEKAKKEAKAKKAAERKPTPKLEKALEQAKEIRENFEKPVDVPAGTD